MGVPLALSKAHVPNKLCGQLKDNGVELSPTHKEVGARVRRGGNTEQITQPTKCPHRLPGFHLVIIYHLLIFSRGKSASVWASLHAPWVPTELTEVKVDRQELHFVTTGPLSPHEYALIDRQTDRHTPPYRKFFISGRKVE